MTRSMVLDADSAVSILAWAAQRQMPITASLLTEGRWCNLRSHMIRYDAERNVIQIVYPISLDTGAPPEIAAGEELGISLRRGHKKCIFVSPVLMRSQDQSADGQAVDTLVVRGPAQMRELQRRVYQRVMIPQDRFIAVKLWQGGLPAADSATWPLCSGRLDNASVGGILVDIRSDQNPRLGVGDLVGVEITTAPGRAPIIAEAQYRHCVMRGPGRMGLGLQFLGLEHDLPDRTNISQIADFVRALRAQ
jgi:c-di-GMP-binding flagellar brake protein YcgR